MLFGVVSGTWFLPGFEAKSAIRQEHVCFIQSRKIGGQPMTTLTREQWESKERADWWSAAQARRRQIYGAATEMMLDVAAGTGDQTLMAARRVGPTGYVLATDQSFSMLNVAAEAARKEGLKNVETRVMNAENLVVDP